MVRILHSPHGAFEDEAASDVAWAGAGVCDGQEGEDLGPHQRWPELRCVRFDPGVGAPVLFVPAEVEG